MMKILEAERRRKGASPHEVVLLQQQQEEGEIGSAIAQETRSEIPSGKIAEGEDTGANPSIEHRRARSRQAAHQDKRPLGLKALGVNQQCHGNCAGAEQNLEGEGAQQEEEKQGMAVT
jgi:hypothetical protein